MTKRTIFALVVLCLCLAAVIAWFRQRSYSRYSTGEVTTLDGSRVVPQAVSEPANLPASNKQPAGHPMTEPEQALAPHPDTPAGDDLPTVKPNGNADVASHAGSGRFQVYSQGDLTWRVDTASGNTCVLFATDEQWRKARVLRHACER